MPQRTRIYDAAIIGAGLAGLTAAWHLSEQGYRCCLLEARNRLGGRIQTQTLKEGQTLEIGAAYLRGTGNPSNPNPLLSLFEGMGIQTSPLDPLNSDFYTYEGKKTSLLEWQSALDEQFAKANTLIQNAKEAQHSPPPSLAQVLEYDETMPAKTSKEFRARQIITATVLQNTGALPNQVSLLELMHDDILIGTDALIVNGTHQLIDGLYEKCKRTENLDLFLKCQVEALHHTEKEGKFRIQTEMGEEYQAEVVICTVPLGIFKKHPLRFTPELSKAKQKAIRHLSLGEHNHVILEFDKAFWPESVHYLYPNDSNVNLWPEYINLMPFTNGRPILLANLYGSMAHFSKQKDKDIIEKVLNPLKRVYPNIPDPKFVKISHWDTERFTAGSIPYCGLLTTEEDLLALQEPEDNGLYFAGDYTSRGQKGLNAAYDSGLNAAMKVVIRLNNKKDFQNKPKPSKKPKI